VINNDPRRLHARPARTRPHGRSLPLPYFCWVMILVVTMVDHVGRYGPILVCTETPNQSGHHRRRAIIEQMMMIMIVLMVTIMMIIMLTMVNIKIMMMVT